MSLRSAGLCLAAAIACFADGRGLPQIRNVYILPMGSGFDQYLANRLTATGRYAVVTDPQLADAVLTDQIGRTFEDRFAELYPPPPAPKPPEEEKRPAKKGNAEPEEPSMASLFGASTTGARSSSLSRGKGNIFLVDRGSKTVVWSTYLRARTSRPDDLNKTADEVVGRLTGSAKKASKMMAKEAAAAQPPVPAPTAAPAPVTAKPATPAPATPPAATPTPAPPAPAPAK